MLQEHYSGIQAALNSGGAGKPEVEARFQRVGRTAWTRLQRHLAQLPKIRRVTERTVDYIDQDIRRTVTPGQPEGPDGSPATVSWLRKTPVWSAELPKYNLRLKVSREVDLQPIVNFTPKVIRTKNRTSYFLYDGAVRVDTTEVSMQDKGVDRLQYEVEVELLAVSRLREFDNAVRYILHQLLDTTELYTQDERMTVIRDVNKLLGFDAADDRINFGAVVQARNLKLRDMVWGGLIGNPTTGYTVTHKADGTRKLLVFHKSGVWFLFGEEANLIRRENFPQLTGTILDGELILPESRLRDAPTSRHWYITFDCLAVQGTTNIQTQPHVDRLQFCQLIADKFKNNLLTVTTKSFYSFNTPEKFFPLMNRMFLEQASLVYKNDGFLFTPTATKYNPQSDQYPLSQRILTTYPDICKWKRLEDLTIDFRIIWRASDQPGVAQLELAVTERGADAPFTGSKFNPFDMKMVAVNHPLTQGLPSGTIVEYGLDTKTGLLEPRRIRADKIRPNHKNIAIDVWDDIHHPIDAETLQGQSFALVRAYHNRIKRILYRSVKPDTLLDIGSGRGGDVTKWQSFRRIVAVEPNPEHRKELERRVAGAGMTDKVLIVPAGGEDTAAITKAVQTFLGGPAGTVSMMLSLSFFWSSPTALRALAQTITQNLRPGGQVIYLSIDGDTVEQVFNPTFRGVVLNRLEMGPCTMVLESPQQLHVDIKGTIVEQQTEWLVRLTELVNTLNQVSGGGYQLQDRHRATTEKFLSPQESLYTEMYSFGAITSGLPVQTPDEQTAREQYPQPPITRPELVPSPKLAQEPLISVVPLAPLSQALSPRRQVVSPRLTSQSVAPVAVSPFQPPVIEPVRAVSPPRPQPLLGVLPPVPPTGRTIVLPMNPPLPATQGPAPSVRAVTPRETKELPWLPVTPPMNNQGVIANTPAYGDDTVGLLTVPWYTNEKVYRIATIGDGSCFFHAFLKGWYPAYQNNANYDYRYNLVKKLRRDLAWLLGQKDPESKTGETYYQTAANGGLVERHQMQVQGVDLGTRLDYSLAGMQRFLNSNDYVGEEMYNYTADVIGFDIYILNATPTNVYLVHIAEKDGAARPAVVIQGNGRHYEVVAVQRTGGLQTNFVATDPFIQAIRNLRRR